VHETPTVYNDVVKTHYIDPMNMDHCNWVYAVLNKEKEIDLRVHEAEGFML
jgi:m7GpppX diphosphatase